jgi:hypothetical protein
MDMDCVLCEVGIDVLYVTGFYVSPQRVEQLLVGEQIIAKSDDGNECVLLFLGWDSVGLIHAIAYCYYFKCVI